MSEINHFKRFSENCFSGFVGSQDEFHFQVLQNLNIIFKISYYTFVTPFCIKRSKDGIFKIHTNKIQQVLTGILNTIAFLYIFRVVLLLTHEGEQNVIKNPKILFKSLLGVSRVVVAITAIYLFWLRRNTLEKLLKPFQDDKEAGHANVRTTLVKIVVSLWILHTLITNILIRVHVVFSNPPLLYRETFVTIPFFNLDWSQYTDLNGKLLPEIRIVEVFLLSIGFYAYFVLDLCSLVILSCSVMIYQICRGFNNRLRFGSKNIGEVLHHYGKVKQQIELINDFVGILLCVYLFELIFRILHVPFAFGGESFEEQVGIFIFTAKGFSILLISGEANAKVSYLKNWLFDYKFQALTHSMEHIVNKDNENKEAFKLLKWDCRSTELGLGCKSFTVTYGSIGLLLSLLGTYAALQLQFYNAAKNDQSTPIKIPIAYGFPNHNTTWWNDTSPDTDVF